jgi:NADH-ubiquinone oxidoreductase chain 3
LVLSLIVGLAGSVFSKKAEVGSEKLSPFECGFSSKGNHRSLFSIQFFLICLIFVIFDVELVVLFPLIRRLPEVASLSELALFISVLILLSVGLI